MLFLYYQPQPIMKAKIIEAISLYHEVDISPTSSDIFQQIDTRIDFVAFTSILAQMVENGELVCESNKYALPDSKFLIELTWNRELEIQYFINQFRAFSQMIKLCRFIKSIGVCKNSFYNNSNEVYLNFIVEKGTVHTTHFLMNKILKWFDRHSIFDTKIQFIIENVFDGPADDCSYFFIREVYPIFGDYTLSHTGNKNKAIDQLPARRSLIGTVLANIVEPVLKRKYNYPFSSDKHINPFCNIQKFIDKIVAYKKVTELIHNI